MAVPEDYPDLAYFSSLGVDIISPDTDEEFWETLSWEEVDKYLADVIMGDARGGTPDQLMEQMPPNALALPAIEAGQLINWEIPLANGYGALAVAMDNLAASVADADAGVT